MNATKLTQERPTSPLRADCGHLCNCFPFEHVNERTREREQWYEHDIYPTYAGNVETGTECGECYRSRMDAIGPMSADDMVRAFSVHLTP